MAEFDEVHGKYIDQAKGKVRLGECWTIQLREPLTVTDAPDANGLVRLVRFIAHQDGTMKPATELDLAEIQDWKRRHRRTPSDWFGLPRGLVNV